ncbi:MULTISPECIES: alpha/beta hydrolase [unclassified Xanthobacter]|uniref:alpha/beta hydrolase n=1 Tax=unclassified Xanthobacter TaxID=2623496 RepID=UPI001EE0F779|nr:MULTISPECIES: alpha/beta fold hydrolase [unclassified Xanthobacter]
MVRTEPSTTILRLVACLLAVLLAGCAARPGPDVLQVTGVPAAGGMVVTLYVATTRARGGATGETFTTERAMTMNYERVTLSIPPTHKPGQIEWPAGPPNPASDFVTVERAPLDKASFTREVGARRHGRPPEIGVFVHGYNTSFQEALFRFAQMVADAGFEGAPVLFAWPSEGTEAGYLADKDAATFSRDQLADLLTQLTRIPHSRKVAVVGHSMGGWLTAEALRQLRLEGRNDVVNQLQVVLAAPDIDVDVFRAQMAVIGPLSPPMVVMVSPDDVALSLSEHLSADRRRIGRLDVRDPRVAEASAKARIQIVDISSIGSADLFRHDRFVALAAMYPAISSAQKNGGHDLSQAGVFVLDAVDATVSSPFVLARRAVSGP